MICHLQCTTEFSCENFTNKFEYFTQFDSAGK